MRFWYRFLLLLAFLPQLASAEDVTDVFGNEKISRPAILFEAEGLKTDKAFVEMARRGAEQAHRELGIKFDQYTLERGEDRQKKLDKIANSGANIIIAVGFENATPVAAIASKYPATHFVIIDGRIDGKDSNVQSVVFKDQEGAFLVGMLAAQASKTGTLGFVGGMDVPLIRNFEYGYEQGAHYIAKDIRVLSAMVGEDSRAWNDPQKANALTTEQLTQGADVVFAAAGGSSVGVLQAASSMGKLAIGIDSNQNGLYPGSVLTSLVKRVDLAVFNALKDARDHVWEPGTLYLSAADGYLDYAIDNNNHSLISKDMIDQIENVKDLISRGMIKVEPYHQPKVGN